MGLDINYVPLNYLETYFVNKDTGLPLSAGIVTFYKDQARTEKKNIFKLSGTPPNYTYVALPNPCTLNTAGCFADASNNDIAPYAYPFDANGDIELYYITTYSNDGSGGPAVLQWTREGQPNLGAIVETISEAKNYITNGQFKVWDGIGSSAGLVSSDVTIIAPGLWSFERPTGSASVDNITFPRFSSAIANPSSYPRYACRVKCQSPSVSDAFKYLSYTWPDVNKFASSSQKYTLFFSAQSNSVSAVSVAIKLRKYYGTGGTVSPEQVITIVPSVVISTGYQNYSFSFIFGVNDGKIMGTNDDDDVAVLLSFPPTSAFDISFTDFALIAGEISLSSFPVMTDEEFYHGSLFNYIGANPKHDGMNLYLPIINTPGGIAYSDADIGKVYLASYPNASIGEHVCDGTMVQVSDYDANGIPYRRLWNKIYNGTYNLPIYGTGTDFIWSRRIPTSTDNIISTTNKPGVATSTADGAVPTAFTFNDITIGSSAYGFKTGIDSNGSIYAETIVGGVTGVPSSGTSGFAVEGFRTALAPPPTYTDIVKITISSIASLAGKYFTICNTTIEYYVWFKVDGSGSDPAPGGTGILINLLSAHTIAEVRQIIKDTLGGFYISNIKTKAASAMTAGCYFEFYINGGNHYYIWYQINGIGTDPEVSSATGVKISLSSAATAADVAFATMYAINTFSYAFPDYRGKFPRFSLASATDQITRDPDYVSRTSWYSSFAGNNVGSMQYWQLQEHKHTYMKGANFGSGSLDGGGSYEGTQVEVGDTGGSQTNSINDYFLPVIKY